MELQANELRIGNKFYYAGRVLGTIEALPMNELNNVHEVIIDGKAGKIKNLQPIPLTEEWLIKFGFKRLKNKWVLRVRDFEIWVNDYFHVTIWRVVSQFHWSDYPRYIHQLQNLYFALTGKELTIK